MVGFGALTDQFRPGSCSDGHSMNTCHQKSNRVDQSARGPEDQRTRGPESLDSSSVNAPGVCLVVPSQDSVPTYVASSAMRHNLPPVVAGDSASNLCQYGRRQMPAAGFLAHAAAQILCADMIAYCLARQVARLDQARPDWPDP